MTAKRAAPRPTERSLRSLGARRRRTLEELARIERQIAEAAEVTDLELEHVAQWAGVTRQTLHNWRRRRSRRTTRKGRKR